MFKEHPEAKELFPFSKGKSASEEEMLKDGQFRSHVGKVFAVIGTAVKEVDNVTEVGKDIEELGFRHYKYKVTMKQYAVRKPPVPQSYIRNNVMLKAPPDSTPLMDQPTLAQPIVIRGFANVILMATLVHLETEK